MSQKEHDAPYIDVLKQLSQYDYLLEQLQQNMADGFFRLSRANFHNKDSLRGRYGQDYYDHSYVGQWTVLIHDNEHVTLEKLQLEEESSDDEVDDDDKLRERKISQTTTEKPTKKLQGTYDPILMFGGGLSAPSSLRQTQTSFKNCLPILIQLINCKNEARKLCALLEATKTT
ncbi:Vma22p KNAG_0B04590 [Huiozyma naganishii CBS 8797]|uniref:Vacuolar ATPase assembly protein VMA22 n=1 Tax=Huiozyma naganishii (strain ATCC MYA-139 / BCRC 22969 / CBS 8797 / KCTC 17520 / NBRC 10181 / NCYC 3082 / Yp74L-3) TaxID=1071383 RepID=J7RH78_HUIN7|nr:hypothetical protein KNAG_0B04590 [Kazachstania naganishii CBS 8797]CCK68893.1 hypothetical protein KNAG_0B04590 [Kazachstania naganishii CBS 8797]